MVLQTVQPHPSSDPSLLLSRYHSTRLAFGQETAIHESIHPHWVHTHEGDFSFIYRVVCVRDACGRNTNGWASSSVGECCRTAPATHTYRSETAAATAGDSLVAAMRTARLVHSVTRPKRNALDNLSWAYAARTPRTWLYACPKHTCSAEHSE